MLQFCEIVFVVGLRPACDGFAVGDLAVGEFVAGLEQVFFLDLDGRDAKFFRGVGDGSWWRGNPPGCRE